jgi:hypothetical protein
VNFIFGDSPGWGRQALIDNSNGVGHAAECTRQQSHPQTEKSHM